MSIKNYETFTVTNRIMVLIGKSCFPNLNCGESLGSCGLGKSNLIIIVVFIILFESMCSDFFAVFETK